MRDDGGFVAICKQIERLGNLNKFAPSRFWIGLPTHLRVAHAGEIERDNVIVFGEEWGDEGKAARVGEKAMCHKHFRLAAVAPAKVMHFSIVDLHITFLARHFQGRHKPFRQMRTISSPDGADIVGKNCHFG